MTNKLNIPTITHQQQEWASAEQIGIALEYPNPEQAIIQIYQENTEEFDQRTTAIIQLTDQPPQRMYTRRGIHLISMFATTEKAKDLRAQTLEEVHQFLSQV